MKPIERFQALLDGKRLRQPHWPLEDFWELINGAVVFGQKVINPGYGYKLHGEIDSYITLFHDGIEWEIYEEPKAEIKITVEDVGKKVRFRSGCIAIITSCHPQHSAPEIKRTFTYFIMGNEYHDNGIPCRGNIEQAIVEFTQF